MRWWKLVFLIAVAAAASGYKFRCYAFCIDQTSTQNDYVEQRDRCREYAQEKLDMALRDEPSPIAEKTRKAKLVVLFSECMGNNDWTVPDGRPPVVAVAPVPPAVLAGQQPSPAAAAATKAETRAALSRTAECDFARQSADVSSIAAARAKACDLECADRLRAAPDAPRPAACPAEPSPLMSHGIERE